MERKERTKYELPELAEILKMYTPGEEYLQKPRAVETLSEREERKEKLFDLVESMSSPIGLVKLKHIINPKNPLFEKIKNIRLKQPPKMLPSEQVERLEELAGTKYLKEEDRRYFSERAEAMRKDKELQEMDKFYKDKKIKSLFQRSGKILDGLTETQDHIELLMNIKKGIDLDAIRKTSKHYRKIAEKTPKTIKIAEELTPAGKTETAVHELMHQMFERSNEGIISNYSEWIKDMVEKGASKISRDDIKISRKHDKAFLDAYKDFKKYFEMEEGAKLRGKYRRLP